MLRAAIRSGWAFYEITDMLKSVFLTCTHSPLKPNSCCPSHSPSDPLQLQISLLTDPPSSTQMALAFHANNFKPWKPRHPQPISLRRYPDSHTPVGRKPPPSAWCCDPSPCTLPPPKHSLPSKPPAEACVPTSSNTQLCSPLSSSSQPQELCMPPLKSEKPRPDAVPLDDQAPHALNSHPTSVHDVQDVISDAPTELPPLEGGAIEAGSPSTGISCSDGSLEDFFRPTDLQNDISIDSDILADDASWGISDLHQPFQQFDDFASLKAICLYSEPPSMFCDAFNDHWDPGDGPGSWSKNS